MNPNFIKQIPGRLEGIIENQDIFLLWQLYEDYLHIERQCQALLAQAEKVADTHYQEQLILLSTIPGVSKLSAVIIFAEIGGDIIVSASAPFKWMVLIAAQK